MSADTVTNPIPLTQTESNTARKKRAKADAATKEGSESAGDASSTAIGESAATVNGETGHESAHVKEVQK